MDENQAYLKALQEEVEKKAKRANQRLRQLEKSGVTESSRAYQVTVRKATDKQPGYVTTAKGNIAFDRRLRDKTIAQLEAELADLDRFLEVHTSTVRGYKKQLRQSYEGFLESTGMTEAPEGTKSSLDSLSFKEYQQLFESKVTEHFGYAMVMAVQREAEGNKDFKTVEKELRKARRKELRDGEKLGQKNLIERVEHPERFDKYSNRLPKSEWKEPKKKSGTRSKGRKSTGGRKRRK